MRLAIVIGIVAAAVSAPGSALAHPGQQPNEHTPAQRDDDKPAAPTKEQIDKRLERVKKRAAERRAKREQRRKDGRRALRKRMRKRLRGGPITAEIKRELVVHARRTARLRRIRSVAAGEGDYATVVAADKALARENARHEGWWRAARNRAKANKNEASPP